MITKEETGFVEGLGIPGRKKELWDDPRGEWLVSTWVIYDTGIYLPGNNIIILMITLIHLKNLKN